MILIILLEIKINVLIFYYKLDKIEEENIYKQNYYIFHIIITTNK